MKRIKNGKLYLIPASTETRGHLTTGNAKFYAQPLQELLQTAPQRTMRRASMKGAAHVVKTAFAASRSSLPEAIEGAHQGTADFRFGNRIFATLGYPDEDWGMVKLTPEQQSMVVEAEPEIFRPVPGGWGKGGSTNVRLKKADATTLKSALTMAWNNVAPRSPPSRARSVDFASHQFNVAGGRGSDRIEMTAAWLADSLRGNQSGVAP